jgi:hypothetical protein
MISLFYSYLANPRFEQLKVWMSDLACYRQQTIILIE